jgi:hypothetical protein
VHGEWAGTIWCWSCSSHASECETGQLKKMDMVYLGPQSSRHPTELVSGLTHKPESIAPKRGFLPVGLTGLSCCQCQPEWPTGTGGVRLPSQLKSTAAGCRGGAPDSGLRLALQVPGALFWPEFDCARRPAAARATGLRPHRQADASSSRLPPAGPGPALRGHFGTVATITTIRAGRGRRSRSSRRSAGRQGTASAW